MWKFAALMLLSLPAVAFSQDTNREEFAALDLNGDGKVSLAEAAGNALVVMRFERADRDQDGKLTPAEFERLKKLKVRTADRRAAARRNAAAGASGRR